ncbi:hypothetical protein GCM10011514_26120 [Emticicia aquatilis]|uniref:Uncharacterized protein n=1 Tax=Emticicia aquatilis TaxID=1537369 RepID=A0A917DRX4_9BACT|nr:hypothetical protein GCM10011514_26120 [Emticicia aquatilis]
MKDAELQSASFFIFMVSQISPQIDRISDKTNQILNVVSHIEAYLISLTTNDIALTAHND